MDNTATSYKIRGIEPSDLKDHPSSVRKLYWSWVVEFGLKRKDRELSEGLDKDGKPLRPISQKTRKYRRSAMTASGKGDPSAPPLTPGHQLSRTRSLLAGRALSTHAEFYWRFDVFTGDSWGLVLSYQARFQGRNVFGLSPEGTAWVKAQATKKWAQYKAGRVEAKESALRIHPDITLQPGQRDMSLATMGIGGSDPARFDRGRWSGGMTVLESRRWLRTPARPLKGRPFGIANRLLELIWGRAK